MDYDEIEREVMRPVPRDLTAGQLAWRGKKMRAFHEIRNAVKTAIKPGDTFLWSEPEPKKVIYKSGIEKYANTTATIRHFQDEWIWIKFTWPDGRTVTRNLGFKRVAHALKFMGIIK